jgi:hypothetical protein
MWHEVQPDGSVVITLRLPPEQATSFLSAAEQFAPPAEVLPDGTRESRAARRADGAVAMATAAHAAEARPSSEPRYLVTLHADVDALSGRDGMCEIEGFGDACELPIGVAAATAARMMCDADVQVLFTKDGDAVGMSAKSSVITGRLRRLVLARDRCCQFPGCGRRAGVDVHHLTHRGRKGSNALSNLAVLCRFHHHRVHEGKWTVERRADHLVFTAPDGRSFTNSPQPLAGNAGQVWSKHRSADDGRSQWCGDWLDLDHVLSALDSAERENSPGSARPRQRSA